MATFTVQKRNAGKRKWEDVGGKDDLDSALALTLATEKHPDRGAPNAMLAPEVFARIIDSATGRVLWS